MSKKITAIVTHSFGEIEILSPIFLDLSKKYKHSFYLIITVEKIYKQLMNNSFYLDLLKYCEVKIIFSKMVNKFDYNTNNFDNFFGKLYLKFIDKVFTIFFFINSYKIHDSDFFMNEITNQKNSLKVLKYFGKEYSKRQLVYHHGHALEGAKKEYKKFNSNPECRNLLFSEINLNWCQKIGLNNNYLIGFPRFYKSWIEYTNNFSVSNNLEKNYITIFTRESEHEYYMDPEKYEYLLINSYKIIRKFYGDIKIVYKMHPRQDKDKTRQIISANNFKNISFSNFPSSVLCLNSILTIHLWCSTILDSLAQRSPAVEFYWEADKFREVNIEGSEYKKNGIHSASNSNELEKIINEIKINEYQFPKITDKFFSNCNLDIFK